MSFQNWLVDQPQTAQHFNTRNFAISFSSLKSPSFSFPWIPSPLSGDFLQTGFMNGALNLYEIDEMSRFKQAERGPNERSNIYPLNADCHDTEKHQHNASTDRFGNVDRDEENDRLTNENSERMIMSSCCGFVEQSEELLTYETQQDQEQPLNLILHKRLHNLTETQQQPNRYKLLNETRTSQKTQVAQESVITGAASMRVRNENAEPKMMAMDVVRDKAKKFHCPVCGKQFSRNHDVGRHLKVHNDKKPFVCDICKQEFRFMTTLSNHMLLHPGEKSFKCNVCGKAFRHRPTFSQHQKIHARVENYNEE